ncbi:MAG: prepilin-type N-terminal cleavage/methylation domain-containing protein [Lachnospiraceae bacterium]|nr:prepilin-type N-terminal cleavage/methylation domain-containing protein [Lachnospiraceae bacterium]
MMFLKNRKIQHKTNKGFTLVELIVVLVLMMILISLSVAGMLTWQDWSRFKKENTAAETIFYSVQDFFTKLDATNAFDSHIYSRIENERSELFLADTNNRGVFANKIYFDEDNYYVWDSDVDPIGTPIWKNTPAGISSADKDKYQGSIWYLSAEKNDYDKYMDGTLTKAGTKLLFDMITTSISDDSILNGAIIVEFSPEAGQVFSVCFSDRTGSFSYLADAPEGSVSVLDRKESVRRELNMGYYSAQSLSVPISGRSKTALGNIRLENKETLNLVVVEKPDRTVSSSSHYTVDVCPVIVNADQTKYADTDSPLFTLDFGLGVAAGNSSLEDAINRPTVADVTFYEGYYASDEFVKLVKDGDPSINKFFKDVVINDDDSVKFKVSFPVWVSKSQANETLVNVLLDGADVQAQSYLIADKNKPAPSLINTYSFYRLGFDLDRDSVMEIAAALLDDADSDLQISNFTSPVFENAKKESDKRIYEIGNGRHLYNVRFETDFKDKRKLESERVSERDFVVTADIDWDVFTNKTPNDDNFNYFLNSYKIGTESGINYDGLDNLINKKYAAGSKDTSGFAFPGFRNLGVNDTFKGTQVSGSDRNTAISNLYISFTANLTYGVYGKDIKEEWLGNDIAVFGRYDTLYSETLNSIDWPNLKDFDQKTYKELHSTHEKAMRGLLPLGLFAQNCGSISDLELNKHRVIGMEDLGVNDANGEKVIIYTCMVGGFAGNDLGQMKNLKLRNVNSLNNANTRDNEITSGENATHINGRRDVGGILGRISWNANSVTDITLSGLENYGNVTGMENVGGVIGRAFLIRDFSTSVSNIGDMYNYYFRRQYYDDGYDIYGHFDDNGKYVQGSSKNIDNRTVSRIDELKIKDCIGRGEVCGDPLIYDNMIYHYENLVETQEIGKDTKGFELIHHDMTNYLKECAFIGGIAGCTMDGQYYDCRKTGSQFESHWGEKFMPSDIKLTMENCNAYRLYSNDALNVLRSKNGTTWKGKISDGHIADLMRHDFYKGGMTGYSKFTRYIGCNNTVASDEPSGSYKSFVFGRNYVGGMIGNFDFSYVEALGTPIENRYNMVNESNVVGVMYVGGFAGGCGVGCCKQENTSFRNPATNPGSQPSQIDRAKDAINTIRNIKNEGVVLSVRRKSIETADGLINKQDLSIHRQQYGLDANVWQEKYTQEYDSGAGGVVGILRMNLRDADNIQKDPAYALSLIGIDRNNVRSVTYDDYLQAFDNTLYGGNGVGGIVGINIVSKINDGGGKSTFSGVVIGDDVVGGILAGNSGNKNSDGCVKNVFPQNALIMGRNMVGGISGINNIKLSYSNNQAVTGSYYVYGKNGVGGVIGALLHGDGTVADVNVSPASGETVVVRAKCAAGGFAGINQGLKSASGSISNINVKAELFAGGVLGATEGNGNTSVDRIQISNSGMNIESRYFAGGFAGLLSRRNNTVVAGFKNIDTRFLTLFNDYDQSGVQAVFNHDVMGSNGALHCDAASSDQFFGAANIPSNATVTATEAGAGGLIGYIPSNMKAVIDLSRVDLNGMVTASNTFNGYSYSGGVTGHIPAGVTVRNASFTGTVNTISNYLGGISEVNNGLIRVCTVNSVTANAYNIYCGGLTGINRGTVSSDNIFGGNAVLRGSKNLGGFIGLNQGNMELCAYNSDGSKAVAQPIYGSHVSMTIGSRDDTAMGFLIGINERDIDLRYTGRIESAQMSQAEEAGVITGINRAHIYNSALSDIVPDAADRNYRLRYEVTNAPGSSLYIFMNVSDVTDAGLVSGRNEGSITDIYINKDPSDTVRGGFINMGDNVDYAGAITGSNGNLTTKGVIERCYNYISIGAAGSKPRAAAGITGKIGGRSAINFCGNYGSIFAKEISAGIAGAVKDGVAGETFVETKEDGTSEKHFSFYDCVNSGSVVSDINFSAGIAGRVNEIASFELCRNYGTGALYAITADSGVTAIHNCLEAGGLNEGADLSLNPIAPVDKNILVRNFYIHDYFDGTPENSFTVPIKDTWSKTDDSHWPRKLTMKRNDDGSIEVVFERADYAFRTGINLSFDPITESDRYKVFAAMDQMFFNMAANPDVYKDGDTDNGDGTVTCGFTGNLNAMTP